jgi:hypothetical protein
MLCSQILKPWPHLLTGRRILSCRRVIATLALVSPRQRLLPPGVPTGFRAPDLRGANICPVRSGLPEPSPSLSLEFKFQLRVGHLRDVSR